MLRFKSMSRAALPTLLLASLVTGGCGADQTPPSELSRGVAPESFVNCEAFHRANERREREERALIDARRLLTERPCSLATFDVPEVQNVGFLEAFALLREAGGRACQEGITGLITTRDSEGSLRVSSSDGHFLGNDNATFVFGEDVVEVSVRRDEVAQTRGLVGGFNGVPAHRVYFNDTGGAVIRAEPGTELRISSAGSDSFFVGRSEDESPARLLRGEAGAVFEVFARGSSGDSSADNEDYRFSISTLPEDVASTMPTWRSGARIRETFTLDGPLRTASLFGPECYGNIPHEPTMELLVQERGRASVGAESSEDAIIAVISPDGVAYCNDDWNGLDPLVEVELTEGVWQFYVGAWSSDVRFPFELVVEPR